MVELSGRTTLAVQSVYNALPHSTCVVSALCQAYRMVAALYSEDCLIYAFGDGVMHEVAILSCSAVVCRDSGQCGI